jgi:tetratricopeptide (TPR) repeat protein
MKRGIWTGLVAFILAKVSHYVITYIIGYVLGSTIGDQPILWDILKITDSPLLGIIYLIIATRFIYKKLLAKDYDNKVTRSSNTDSKIPDQKNNLEIIDKIVENSSTKQDEVSNLSDSNAFDTNVETSWGGEEPSILTFFKKYVSNKEELVLKKVDTFKNNIFYAKEDSNQIGRIFIFFEEANEAIEKFKAIVEPHSNNEQFFKLKSDQISGWISEHKSEIQCLSVEGCLIQLSKGVNLNRIDIFLKNSFKWTDINSVNKDNAIIFAFPFSSLIKNDLPDIEFNFDLSESLMITSIYFNTLKDYNIAIPIYEDYYSEDEIKVFAHTKDFKSFWNFSRNYVFIDSIDPMQTEIFKNIFEKLNSEFTLFDKLNLSYQLIQSPQETFTIDNDDLSAITEHTKYSERTSELLRLNKYFDIQDGEFILFLMMKGRMNEVKPFLDSFKDLEDLFVSMKNESNELAVELRKKLVGDLPLKLIDRPKDIRVTQEDDETTFSSYSESTIKNYNRAIEKLQSGNHQIAAVELEKVIEQDSFMLPAYNNLTAIKINFEQDYVGAIKTLDKIINAQGYEHNPDKVYAGLFFNRGLAKSYLDREEAAISDFNESLKIDPEFTSCYGSRGCSLMNLNRNIEALEDFNKVISLGDKTFINYFNRGKCKQSLTKFSEALDDYNSAYELNPENENVIMQRDLLQAMKDNGLMDQIEQLTETDNNKINIDEEKISFIYELLMRVSLADNKLDNKEALLIAASLHKMKELYQFEGKVKRAESLSFFSKSDEFSDDEKTSIIGLLISLISIDEVVTYSELSLVISFCLGLNLSIDVAEDIIDSICKNDESLDKNTFYLYITEIYSSLKNEISDQAEENYDLVNQILNLEQEKVAEKFKSLPLELKTEIFFASIMYDEKRSLARQKADKFNDQAWEKMENSAYDDALTDAKKSIDTLSMSNNNDTIALIYYHLKNYDEAIKYSNVSIELDESRSDHYVTRAKIYIKLKKTDLAKIDLNKAIELDEGDEEAKILSDSLESSLQNETLNSHFNDLKENVQDKAVVAEWTNSEFEEYLKQSNKVNTKLLYDLREEYFQLDENENYPEAIKRLTQIIEYIPVLKGQSLIAYVDPSDMLNGISLEEIYFNRSQLYSKLSLYYNAKNDLIKAVNSNPVRKEPIIHHHLGCTMIQCGDFTSCIEHFNIAIEKDPEYYDSYYMRAVAYSSESSELHDINQARKDLEIYLDKYPEDGAANKLLEIINP